MSHYDDHDSGYGWGTPAWVVDPLSAAIGGFDLDPASGAEPKPYAEVRYTESDDGLSSDWFGDVWLNPPYGRNANPEWAERATNQFFESDVDTITALIPAATDTGWFQDHYAKADYITFIRGRVEFEGGDGRPSFASVIASFGDFSPEYTQALGELGEVFSNQR